MRASVGLCSRTACLLSNAPLVCAALQALEAGDAVGEAMDRLDAAIAEERFEGGLVRQWQRPFVAL